MSPEEAAESETLTDNIFVIARFALPGDILALSFLDPRRTNCQRADQGLQSHWPGFKMSLPENPPVGGGIMDFKSKNKKGVVGSASGGQTGLPRSSFSHAGIYLEDRIPQKVRCKNIQS